MSLRLRLGLWYGVLTGLVVLLTSVIMYAVHTRGHYDDMDYTLQTTALHLAQEYESGESLPGGSWANGGPAVISQSLAVWIFTSQGQMVARSIGAADAPTPDPLEILAHQPGPVPFDPLAALAPHLMGSTEGSVGHPAGTFGLANGNGGPRWRLFVLPFHLGNHLLVVGGSLERVDASVTSLRWLAVVVTVLGASITLLAGWALARRALRPVALLTDTASAISHSRALDKRVPVSGDHDELGKMALTFNDMLANLENAYRAQQRFVSDASHELRAPLTAIQGNLDLLDRVQDMPPAERQEAIAEARREAHRLSRLVADLLALARADAGVAMRREAVELDRVLMQAFSEARHFARGHQMEVSGLEPALVLGDADRLKQLFLILLDNATKYTPPTGRVTVSMRRAGGESSAGSSGYNGSVDSNASQEPDAGHVLVEVRDTGIGIPAEDLPHVFERFYRADPARGRDPGGTGLGLSIAGWIVEQHGGDISVDSKPGSGTTFTVRLPLPAGTGAAPVMPGADVDV